MNSMNQSFAPQEDALYSQGVRLSPLNWFVTSLYKFPLCYDRARGVFLLLVVVVEPN